MDTGCNKQDSGSIIVVNTIVIQKCIVSPVLIKSILLIYLVTFCAQGWRGG